MVMSGWIMTSEVQHDPWLLTFRIGEVRVAEVTFETNKVVLLRMWDWSETFHEPKAVSQAMTAMHRRLKTPPAEKVI